MFKKILTLAVAGAASLLVASQAYAQCGGYPLNDSDLSGNSRPLVSSCCPAGYRVQGMAYSDMRNSGNDDRVDAVSAICRSIAKGNDMMVSDFQSPPITLMCPKEYVNAGGNCVDLRGEDALDGCVIYCQKPGSTELMMVGNNGDSGPTGSMQTVLLPKRIVGIGMKDLDKGPTQSSDRADGVVFFAK
jgi:hypothetical protein